MPSALPEIGPLPDLSDVIRLAVSLAVAELHVSLPAKVVRVDLAKGQVDAKPVVKDVLNDANGNRIALSVPVVTNVPLVFPGAGGMRITFPVAVGDTVLLVFSDRSLDSWAVQGGEVDPLDDRHHHLSDAIAIPGLRDFGHAWKGVDAGTMTIGKDGAAQHAAGLGDRIRTELDAVWAAIYGATGHTHTSNGTPATGLASKQTVTSGTVKVTE